MIDSLIESHKTFLYQLMSWIVHSVHKERGGDNATEKYVHSTHQDQLHVFILNFRRLVLFAIIIHSDHSSGLSRFIVGSFLE